MSSQEFYCDEIDDDDCSTCGGSGVLDGECDCMDDACCCLYPTTPDCPECKFRMGVVGNHHYVPSTMHMGDCAICGHIQHAAVHKR